MSLGDKALGRTSTQFLHGSDLGSAVWGEIIHHRLIHLEGGPLRLLAYNWSEGREDDFLGECSVSFDELREEALSCRKSLRMVGLADDTSFGELLFRVSLKAVELFHVVERPPPSQIIPTKAPLLSRELSQLCVASPLRAALEQVAEELENRGMFDEYLLRDLLFDALSLEGGQDLSPTTLTKEKCSLRGSTTFVVDSSEFIESPPMKGCTLRILTKDGQQFLLSFTSRFSLWLWMRNLMTSLAWMKGDASGSTLLPAISLHAAVDIVDSKVTRGGKCWVSSSQPDRINYEMVLDESIDMNLQQSFNLTHMKEMTMSIDSPPSANYNLQISIRRTTLGKDVASPSLTFSKFYFILKFRHESVSTTPETFPNPVFKQKLNLDVTAQDIMDESTGVYVFFFSVPQTFGSRPQLLGEQYIPLRKLLNIPDQKNVPNEGIIGVGKSVETSHPLNSSLLFAIKLHHATNLPLLKGQNVSTEREIYAKCSFFGSSLMILPRRESMKDLKSGIVRGGVDVDLGSITFLLHSDEGLYSAQYVRIRLFSRTEELGEIFIPIEDFGSQEMQRRYELVEYGGNITSSQVIPHRSSLLLSTQLQKLSSTSASSVDFTTAVFQSNEYNTIWHAECIPHELLHEVGVTAEDIDSAIEVYGISPGYSHLELHEPNQLDDKLAATRGLVSNNTPLGNSVDHDLSQLKWSLNRETSNPGSSIRFSVYENERQGGMHPAKWSFNYLHPTDPPRFSDLSGMRELSLISTVPNGYEWVNDWQIVNNSEEANDEGWSYAVNFGQLCCSANLPKSAKEEVSSRKVRRRLWTREARLIPGDEPSITDPMTETEDFRELNAAHINLVLKLCREKISAHGAIRIPWSKVLVATVCSPSILILLVEVGRYDTANEGSTGFTDTKIEVFITNCPAEGLKNLIEERKSMDALRKKMTTFTGTEPSYEFSACSELFTILHEKMIEIDYLTRATSSLPSGIEHELYSKSKLDAKSAYNKIDSLRYYRLLIFQATLICCPFSTHNFLDPRVIERLVHSDLSNIENARKGDVLSSLASKVGFLTSTADNYLHELALTGWLYRGVELNTCLLQVIQFIFTKVLKEFSLVLDLPKLSFALKGLTGKLNFIRLFARNAKYLERQVVSALKLYGLNLYPSPLLELALPPKYVLDYLTTLAMSEIDEKFDEIFSVIFHFDFNCF